jgi:integrase/recombinase XerD
MSILRRAVDDYLALRRSLGFKLEAYSWMLGDFVDYLEDAGATRVTTELAVAWAALPGEGAHPSYLAKRLCVVRGFARHLSAFDPATEVPPVDLGVHQACRRVPYIYSDDDVASLLRAARSLAPELRGMTYATLLGLLSVSGARIGELIGLDRGGVDVDGGVLVIRYTKFNKTREVPLHESTVGALVSYAAVRDELCPRPKTQSFFVSMRRGRLSYETVQHTFRLIARDAGLEARSEHCRPRLHDARHSFACATLLHWNRSGLDVEAHLPLLSTYMGHARPEHTYWYLSATPELLSLAARRRDQVTRSRP